MTTTLHRHQSATGKPKRIYLFVNGIKTFPGLSKNWNRRAVTWTHINTEHKAESLEYLMTAFRSAAGAKYRASKLVRKLEFYNESGFEIHIVAHSNGSNVVLNALREFSAPVAAIHFIAPACEEDCQTNGLNDLIRKGFLRKLHVYIGGEDIPCKLASTLGRLVGFGGMGVHGAKWLTDPVHSEYEYKLHAIRNMNHGSWFEGDTFTCLMLDIHKA